MSSELIGKKLQVALRALREVNRSLAAEYARLTALHGGDEGGRRYGELTPKLREDALRVLASAEELRDLALHPTHRGELEAEVGAVRREEYGGTLVVKKVACGKRCRGCPHGPYIYRVTRAESGGRQRWIYLGKAAPTR
ncbi:hypothetical protein B9Q08_02210 [Candidatus Marsarchaeota G2 archaeon ECH_B_SAG-M15]|jgi:TPP-dependent indolepyruvate ferredoxin oxidoreductase alpha subunit|uniref:DUF6788 domain-containing protein n=1 Tax=Candidatus Marsarchaeota G2 archaeon ECH_B_SAG-M15 TaxID=1978162 RepID=A0A2R6AZH6_9ARCH|nr:MAG: hypothetical protein B9Q08_02210 [Candidatus Marsarchaeota G2 archaeon ECH_B_SAG-M15]